MLLRIFILFFSLSISLFKFFEVASFIIHSYKLFKDTKKRLSSSLSFCSNSKNSFFSSLNELLILFFKMLQLLRINRLMRNHLLLQLQMILKNDLRSLLKCHYRLSLITQHLLHFGLTITHIFTYLLQRFLLPLNNIQTQLRYLSKIRSEIFPKPLLISINPIIRKTFLLYPLILPLIILVRSQLLLQLINQHRLDLDRLLTSLQFLTSNTITSIMKKSIIRIDLKLTNRFPKKLRKLFKRTSLRLLLPNLSRVQTVQPLQLHQMLLLYIIHRF